MPSPNSDDSLPIESRAVRRARDISKSWHTSHRTKQRQLPPPSIELPEGHPAVEEQDFTTPGATSGRLGCPFAAMAAERNRAAQEALGPKKPPTPKSDIKEDPIAAEFHVQSVSSPPPSASGSGAKCPIRFLDQHKPEEVAQYFENHKHEIPRSHEICIKQYQTNEESIRRLDAKYGSLVNMIQGLGMKHKPMLPEEASGEALVGEADGISQVLSDKEAAKIQRWAGSVPSGSSAKHPSPNDLVENEVPAEGAEEARTSRFQRALRDVRLGESPSRPWGIQVPADFEAKNEEHVSEPDRVVDSGLRKDKASIPQPASPTPQAAIAASDAKKPALVFNGPVFFGYSAEDMAHLLKDFPQLISNPAMPAGS